MHSSGNAVTRSRSFGAAILGCGGARLSDAERRFFAEANPFGFILFARNIETHDQLLRLTSDLRQAVGWSAPIFIDQEGGRVQRLRAPLATEWSAPLDHVAEYGPNAETAMYLRYRIIAAELLRCGIDANCAPMLDVARAQTHPFLRNRCYGSDLDTVVKIGRAVANGLSDGGVYPVMKHIPGHGLAQMDSHLDLPRVGEPRSALDATDFAAFKPFTDLSMGMTAHLVFEAIDPEPATISRQMIRLIREEIGFEGLLMTDDISMEALSGTVPERAEASIKAGCDLVLHCNGDLDEMKSLMSCIGTLSDQAQSRADKVVTARPKPETVDITELQAKLAELPLVSDSDTV